MATIINQANLTYTYGTTTASVLSNPAATERTEALAIEKRALETAYRAGDELTYLIAVQNSGAAPVTNLAVQDNLGAAGGVVPLTYTGPAALYIDGVFSETLSPEIDETGATFTIPELPAGSNALIVYQAAVNGYAPLTEGGEITNTASIQNGAGDPLTASATVPVDAYADVSIEKEMSPNPIEAGGRLVVTFTIENRGNVEATDLVLTDAFPVALSDVAVTVNGASVTDFTFEDNTLTLPASEATTLTVPAATFETAASGAVTIVPGTLTVTVTGTI
ncbi:MAG: DUF11 domain-containing protein [Clostridia bacterium]|nr:DUF11 domain-containing protein [Clostridia bacterium]